MKYPIKETIKNANDLAEIIDSIITLHKDSEGTEVLIMGDYEHYKDIESHIQELVDNRELDHANFYDELRTRLDRDTSFILLS